MIRQCSLLPTQLRALAFSVYPSRQSQTKEAGRFTQSCSQLFVEFFWHSSKSEKVNLKYLELWKEEKIYYQTNNIWMSCTLKRLYSQSSLIASVSHHSLAMIKLSSVLYSVIHYSTVADPDLELTEEVGGGGRFWFTCPAGFSPFLLCVSKIRRRGGRGRDPEPLALIRHCRVIMLRLVCMQEP